MNGSSFGGVKLGLSESHSCFYSSYAALTKWLDEKKD
jgi:hypothetical protein